MRWRRNLRFSWAALCRHRARTLLSVSGVAVGIAAVGGLLALEAGGRRALERTLDELGSHLLVVSAARTAPDALRGVGRTVETLTRADAEALAGVSTVSGAAPVVMRSLLVEHRGQSLRGNVVGTTPALGVMRNDRLAAGRGLDADDIDGAKRVAVIGSQIRRELFAGELPLGETVLLGPGNLGAGVPFTVVGVMREKGNSPDGANQDDQVVVPVSAAQRRLTGIDHVDRIFLQAASRPALDAAAVDVASVLRHRHGLVRGDDFELQDQDALWAGRLAAGGSMRQLVAALAALALVLGGSGLLAVCWLSVRERRAEIGLRLAVGARRRDIFLQFLAEAVLLSVLGTAVGLAVALAVSAAGARLLSWPLAVDWRLVAYPIGFCLLVAAGSGALPAYRAASWDPIAALRGSRS